VLKRFREFLSAREIGNAFHFSKGVGVLACFAIVMFQLAMMLLIGYKNNWDWLLLCCLLSF